MEDEDHPRGRLYWSDAEFARRQEMADQGMSGCLYYRLGTHIGRLDDGTEVEYTEMLTDDSEPEGDSVFLGWGVWLGPCRTLHNETPLEKIEAQLMTCPWVPERLRNDGRFVEAFARFLRDGGF